MSTGWGPNVPESRPAEPIASGADAASLDFDALAERIDTLDFETVFTVSPDGEVTELHASGIYAPSVFHDDDNDVFIDGPDGWQCFTGITGQYGYHGAVMHPSEYVGPGFAREVAEYAAEHPGAVFAIVWVEVMPDDEDPDPEPAGWTIAYRDLAAGTQTWADGYGRWHAKVPAGTEGFADYIYAVAYAVAKHAIMRELAQREANVSPDAVRLQRVNTDSDSNTVTYAECDHDAVTYAAVLIAPDGEYVADFERDSVQAD